MFPDPLDPLSVGIPLTDVQRHDVLPEGQGFWIACEHPGRTPDPFIAIHGDCEKCWVALELALRWWPSPRLEELAKQAEPYRPRGGRLDVAHVELVKAASSLPAALRG